MSYFTSCLFVREKQSAGGVWGKLRAAGSGAASNVAPAALGGAAGYGTWHAAVPEDADLTQKVEGALAAGLAGVGASGFGRAGTWRNVLSKSRAATAADVTKGLRPDLTKHLTSTALSDVVAPKLKFMGASLVPVGMSNVQSLLANAGRATGNVAGVTDTWKELADQVAAKDPSGKSVVEQVRDAVTKITADAETASGTLAQGTQDITGSLTDATRNISGNLENASTAFADATKNVGRSLSDASDSFAGASGGIKDLTETVAPVMKDLAPVLQDIARKDEGGGTIFSNLNQLFRNLNTGVDDFRQSAKDTVGNLNRWRQFGDAAKTYAPYVAGAGLTAGGLYSLYRALNRAKKIKRLREDDDEN
jgi:ABC-type transporter Mla subunit MlaD